MKLGERRQKNNFSFRTSTTPPTTSFISKIHSNHNMNNNNNQCISIIILTSHYIYNSELPLSIVTTIVHNNNNTHRPQWQCFLALHQFQPHQQVVDASQSDSDSSSVCAQRRDLPRRRGRTVESSTREDNGVDVHSFIQCAYHGNVAR